MTEEIRVNSCYAITIKYLPPTNTKGTRIKLIPSDDLKYGLDFKSITLPYNYETNTFNQAVNYVVNVLGMPLPKYNLNTGDQDILIFDKPEVNNIFYFNKESVG
tara:strand:+ start:2530 stop:2841 length:312 start_codon:yes stop_codon:yes gene_type:complete